MILPEDIEKQQFEVSFRGYNTREVDEFLNRVRTELTEILEEQEVLKRKVAAAELIAKDAKDHEEDFIASMQADKEKAEAILAAAKTEGERIIREAKNAASGIMAEVRRRAGDISSESRRASADIIESAEAEAAEIRNGAATEADELVKNAAAEAARLTEAAKAAADKKMFNARTEADNIVKAASAEARTLTEQAAKNAAEMTKRAADAASMHEEYIKEVRAAAEKLCFEIDTELKNSAARIALLGKRISSADLPERTEAVAEVKEEPVTEEVSEPVAEELPTVEEPVYEAPAHAVSQSPMDTEAAPAPEAAPAVEGSHGGYFSQEYRQAMTELFGDDADVDIPESSVNEDDDTYDYIDHAQVADEIEDDYDADGDDDFDDIDTLDVFNDDDDDEDDEDDDEDDGEDGDTVTSEYSGIPSGKGSGVIDIFSDDALDRIYGSPTKDDIDDILNEDD